MLLFMYPSHYRADSRLTLVRNVRRRAHTEKAAAGTTRVAFSDCVDDFVLSHGNRVMDHLGVAAHQKADRSPAGLRDTAGGQFFLAFIFLPWQMV